MKFSMANIIFVAIFSILVAFFYLRDTGVLGNTSEREGVTEESLVRKQQMDTVEFSSSNPAIKVLYCTS